MELKNIKIFAISNVIIGSLSSMLLAQTTAVTSVVKKIIPVSEKESLVSGITKSTMPGSYENTASFVTKSQIYLDLREVMGVIFEKLQESQAIKKSAEFAAKGNLAEAKNLLVTTLQQAGAVKSEVAQSSSSIEYMEYYYKSQKYYLVYVHGVDEKIRLMLHSQDAFANEWYDASVGQVKTLVSNKILATYVIYKDQSLNEFVNRGAEQVGAEYQSYEKGNFGNKVYYGYLEPIQIFEE